MKQGEVIILNHNGGQLANQLWNHISIFSYALEKGYVCKNYCFFEYARFFSITPKNKIVDILFYRSFNTALHFLPFFFVKKIIRKLYGLYQSFLKIRYPRSTIYSRTTKEDLGTYFLPPTEPAREELRTLEDTSPIMFDGWLFRNPMGIRARRREVLEEIRPVPEIEAAVRDFIEPLRARCATVIGVHIRQGDYVHFKHGRFFTEQKRVREIINQYVERFSIDINSACFVICSDEPVESRNFEGLLAVKSERDFIHDLFILASCDTVLGSDSTFGALAAYYGDIPHVIFKNEPIDWEYYRGKEGYFDNKYSFALCNFPKLWDGSGTQKSA